MAITLRGELPAKVMFHTDSGTTDSGTRAVMDCKVIVETRCATVLCGRDR